mgnify:CR=1 FL=1
MHSAKKIDESFVFDFQTEQGECKNEQNDCSA